MQPRIHTRLETNCWKQCFECGAPTLIHELTRRPKATSSSRGYNLFGAPTWSVSHHTLVDVCPTCDWNADETIRRQQRRTRGVILTIALLAAAYFYPVTVASVAVLVVLAVAVLKQKRNHKALIVR